MRQIILVSTYFFTLIHCFSQSVRFADHQCVDNQEMLTQRIIENKQLIRDGMAFSRETIYVPVTFHLVADDEGLGRADVEDVLKQLCDLNSEFENTGFTFYIDDGFNYIDNSLVFNSPSLGAGVAEMIRQKRGVGASSLNIFVTGGTRDIGNGRILGFYAIENDWVVINKDEMGNGQNTLAHEIGHFFSLAHPHTGWEFNPWTEARHGNPVLLDRINGIQIELVDGSNCETAGDQLCDTPPDYNFGLPWDSRCPTFNLNVMDRNGDTIVPQQNNHMSYFSGCVPYTFTNQQTNVMMAEYGGIRRENIRRDYIPNQTIVANTLELISPENNATAQFHNGVELSWTPVENATQYFVELKSGLDKIIRFTENTEIYITELLPDKVYTWTVIPFNETSTCAEQKNRILRTSDATTNTIDPLFAESIALYPNPISEGESIKFQFQSSADLNGVLKLFSGNGQVLHTQLLSVQIGTNTIAIDLDNIQSGMYLLSYSTAEGNINRKFIINN